MIQTVDNYHSHIVPFRILTKKAEREAHIRENAYYCISNKTPASVDITLADFKDSKNSFILPLFQSRKKKDEEIILSVRKQGDDGYVAQTGNFIGKFIYEGLEIDIKSRFSELFLQRMLNFANDVYLDDVAVFEAQESKDFDYAKYVIYYMFIQKLERAFLLGMPRRYISIYHHDMRFRGKTDINRHIRNDIPFRGKIASVSREQREIQEIIDILYKAVTVIEKNSFSTKNISHIKAHLKQQKSNRFVSGKVINKALGSKALQNPLYSPYKKIIELAKLIIDADSLEEKKDADKRTFGFLIDVSELFELYLYKLLKRAFSDWDVIYEEQLNVYDGLFYARNMYPDIVMKRGNKIVVFDAKYKKMVLKGRDYCGMGDLDRSDFFQIHTYMSYYEKNGYEVLGGGLLYPMDEAFDKAQCVSENWLGGEGRFVVDGIDLSGLQRLEGTGEVEALIEQERAFVERIRQMCGIEESVV